MYLAMGITSFRVTEFVLFPLSVLFYQSASQPFCTHGSSYNGTHSDTLWFTLIESNGNVGVR